ncbi:MAG: MBL fold metallo-hydrolase [Pseudomonadales bacterium]
MLEQVANTDIFTIDAEYEKPDIAAIHLVREGDQLAIIDTGTVHSIPALERALDELGLSWQSVSFVILTHIHLDHAGGAGHIMQRALNARLVVHQKGARHMVDPSRLVEGSVVVYGKEAFERLYGEIVSIDSSRMHVPHEGETISLNGRVLEFLDTPGHANHHHCIWDAKTQSMFTGDTLGVGYRALRSEDRAVLMPSSTPVQFNPEALHASIEKVMDFAPKQLYLTHFGAIEPNKRLIDGLHEQIDAYVQITEEVAASTDAETFEAALGARLSRYLSERAARELENVPASIIAEWVPFDAELNALGLAVWWRQQS